MRANAASLTSCRSLCRGDPLIVAAWGCPSQQMFCDLLFRVKLTACSIASELLSPTVLSYKHAAVGQLGVGARLVHATHACVI